MENARDAAPVDAPEASCAPADDEATDESAKLEQAFRSGANWFYWIAGLSLVNSAGQLFGAQWGFVLGLGVTQIIDAIAASIAQEAEGAATAVKLVAFGLDVVIAGFFVALGVLANRRCGWSFYVGMAIYFLDGLIFLAVGNFLGVGFHGFVLFCLFSGVGALKKLQALAPPAPAEAALAATPAPAAPATDVAPPLE